MPKRIYLLDGSALVYRAHFAFARNPLITSDGRNVSAVFGFAQTLFNVLREQEAEYAAVAFDTGAPTFRHERYKQYKANRPPTPDELITQMPVVRSLVDAAGLKVLERDGVEADDLIASLAIQVSEAGGEVVIVSADKDFHQLLRNSILQWIPPRGREKGTLFDPEKVRIKWGVEPPRVLDVLALMGDAVDNVPGVKGVGEKTARQLIEEYGDLDQLYSQIEQVARPVLREKLRASREEAFLSRELIRLRTDLFPEETIEAYRVPSLEGRRELLQLLQELEFRRLIDSLKLRAEADWQVRYEAITDPGRLREVLSQLPKEGGSLAIDTETDSLDARRARAVGISLCWRPGEAYYLPLSHCSGENMTLREIHADLTAILEDERIEKVGQNMKFDLHVLQGIGLAVRGPLFDTLVASYLLDPDRPHDLDSLTFDMLGHRKIPTVELIGKGKDQTTMDRLSIEKVRDYAAEDADAALRLHEVLLPALRDRGAESLYREVEAPLIPILTAMENAGVHIDRQGLSRLSKEMEVDQDRLEKRIHQLAGGEFNINSPSQLGRVLFDHLKLPRGKKTKTGYSTDQEVLEKLAPDAPIAGAVLEYRQLSKLRSTYVEALPKIVDQQTGRIHGRFHQTVAATGRLSSSDPNLQNIPVRTPLGRRIRQAFTAQDKGAILISADYSQIELRLLAHLSSDDGLVAAFAAGEDIHAATAARIFDVGIESVDPDMRGRAKTVNFGVLYGMGASRLSRELGIPIREAKTFIEQYFAKMPGVKRYQEENLSLARANGYVTTLLGRRRYLPGLQGEDPRARSQAERIAANTPIQGSAADLIKRAMIQIHDKLRRGRFTTRMILQVHDELLFEGPEAEYEAVAALVVSAMEAAAELVVPLKVDLGFGANWDRAHG
jgi:DNA polymerase-1